MEVVGVVLGALPLLIAGIKSLKPVLQNAQAVRYFGRQFPAILDDIRFVTIQFEQNTAFLRRILQRGMPNMWETDETTVDWNILAVRLVLEVQLGTDVVSLLAKNIRRQEEIISKVLKLLERGKELATPLEKAQFKIAFIKSRQSIQELRKLGEDMWRTLERAEKLSDSRSRPTTMTSTISSPQLYEMTETIGRLQRQAYSLCQWLCGPEWDCGCLPSHACGITASCHHDDSRSRSPYLELLMGGPSKLARVEIVLDKRSFMREGDRAVAEYHEVLRLTRELQMHGTGEAIAQVGSMMQDQEISGNKQRGDAESSWDPRSLASTPALRLTPRISCSIFMNPAEALRSLPRPAYRPTLKQGPGPLEFGDQCLAVHDDDVKPLEQFYRNEPYLHQRLRLGLELAYCILSLGGTSWFPGGWDCDDISVVLIRPRNDMSHSSLLAQAAVPFYQHKTIRSDLSRDVSDREAQSQMAVFSLGVILLQLLARKRPEEQALWNRHTDGGREHALTLWETAMDWRETVEYPGPGVESAVYQCIDLGFGMTVDLQGPKFVRKFLESVVLPLERAVRLTTVG
ncbi:hypothetical protein B0T11DRAFT_269912 [Plectosphaerella cucumerina]|uniref:Prion-inhibition and propagation HeLo domain-containing protein n=1 Tax=Plectosphaerella cucumerina TaxID=40658 RepID=A0A8K0TRX1_9PEZI|nr:hypothetical protein B0T11DRAFT_269912 [Plectosphaerella cucumerina]